ncbi:MAG: YegS/Rv2252/BmrU family lipid kinase [Chloroflexi bacterium]|nr:YegS/Rv2252/BmrU family lipid kinase [Chloroflexota bacterium]
MGKIKEKDRSISEKLAETQASHAKQLKKVEQTLAKFEKQRHKLATLEEELALQARRCFNWMSEASITLNSGDAMLERVYIIVNPKSKGLVDGTVRIETIVQELRRVGILAEVGLKTSGKVARLMARAAVKRGDRLLLVAGGDGTIEDIACELIGSETTLGILPVGTMNNLARALGVPLDLRAACLLLAMGATRHLDIGQVITTHPHKTYFMEMAGVGLSALAAPMGQALEKGRWRMLLGSLDNFLTFKAVHVVVTCDNGEILHAETNLATLCNSPLFGNHMLAAPGAKMDDGLLDLALYDGMSKPELEAYFLNISNGKRVESPGIRYYQVRKVRITADKALAANADGTVLPEQPAWEFEMIPHAIRVIVGNGIALTLPVEAAPPPPPLSGPQLAPEGGIQ